MLPYLFAVLSITAATLIPAFVAFYAISNLKTVETKYIAALGLGLTFWFFIDTFTDATELDSNSSVIYGAASFGGWYHLSLIAVFILGIATLAAFDHYAPVSHSSSSDSSTAVSADATRLRLLILIPAAVALVMGIHTLGEGYEFGGVAAIIPASGTTLNALTAAFAPGIPIPSAYFPLVSYPIHKFLESVIVACVYVSFVRRNESAARRSWHIPVLVLLFGLTSLLGTTIGYYVLLDPTYFFAFGVTAALYSALRLSEAAAFARGKYSVNPSYLGSKVFIAITVGFFLLYTANLLH